MTLAKPMPSFAVLTALAMLPRVDADAQSMLSETQRIEWSGVEALPAGALFGARVAIAEVGFGTAGIGAPGSGAFAAYGFENGQWSPSASFELSTPQPVAMCSDGEMVFWGEESVEAMDLYTRLRRDASEWFLLSVAGQVEALARDGGVLAVGEPSFGSERGRVRIYEDDGGGSFELQATFVGGIGDRLGSSLALDGDVLVAGAPEDSPNGSVKVWVRTSEWIELQEILSPATSQSDARFGASVALRGDVLVVGSPNVDRVTTPGARVDVGAAYVYEGGLILFELAALLRPAGAWHDDHVGASVALHDFAPQGLALAVGAPGEDVHGLDEGAAHLYVEAAGAWTHFARLIDSEGADGDALGASVALGELGLLAGAPHAAANGVADQGAVLFFGQLFVLFADGFEGGDAGEWSMVFEEGNS